jgi:ubiquinone/menaquinone biosynthesis C-methylase UbiE
VALKPKVLNAIEAYRIWSQNYDETPNALLALETRVLSTRLGEIGGRRVLDAGSGTGRWMEWAKRCGACVFGIDVCHEMILQAVRKPGLEGRSARADLNRIPVRDDAADIAICSFTLGYLASAGPVLRELARVARRVIVSDLHPAAVLEGWSRSFRAGGELYEVKHYDHPIEELGTAAAEAGLTLDWRVEPTFGEAERGIFERAGKESAFEDARRIPAVLITAWTRSPG